MNWMLWVYVVACLVASAFCLRHYYRRKPEKRGPWWLTLSTLLCVALVMPMLVAFVFVLVVVFKLNLLSDSKQGEAK